MNGRFLMVLAAMAVPVLLAAGPAPSQFSLEPGPALAAAVATPEPSDWVDADETLHWDGAPDRGFSINGTYSYGCAQRYTEETGLVVKAILYYLTGSADDVFAYVAGESTNATPGAILDTMRTTGQGGGVWRRAEMPHPPAIDPNTDFWACVIIRRHPAGQSPMTLDLGPIVAYRGGYITLPSIGPDWYQLTDPPFWTDRNVNIRAVVERAGVGVEEIIGPAEPPPAMRAWPNPACVRANIAFRVRRQGTASLDVYDEAGKLVRSLFRGVVGPGEQTATWDCRADDGRRVPAGTYLYRLTADGRTSIGRTVVLD